jgi:hypothetical protein
MICSQEGRPGTSRSTREIANDVQISAASVRRIAKADLNLSAFKRIPVQVVNAATKTKRLMRGKALLRRLTLQKLRKVFFTDEKVFYLDPPVNCQNDRLWATGRKRDVIPERLLAQRAKFSACVMVSAGVSFGSKGQLHFVAEKAKINAEYYVRELLPKLIEDCQTTLPNGFIFQQDGAPAHSSKLAQEWLKQNSPDFIAKDDWPPNSPDLNPLDYHVWGAMLAKYQAHTPKPKNKTELKATLQQIWSDLPQEDINKAVLQFTKRLKACISAEGGHFEHQLY